MQPNPIGNVLTLFSQSWNNFFRGGAKILGIQGKRGKHPKILWRPPLKTQILHPRGKGENAPDARSCPLNKQKVVHNSGHKGTQSFTLAQLFFTVVVHVHEEGQLLLAHGAKVANVQHHHHVQESGFKTAWWLWMGVGLLGQPARSTQLNNIWSIHEWDQWLRNYFKDYDEQWLDSVFQPGVRGDPSEARKMPSNNFWALMWQKYQNLDLKLYF